MRAHATRIPYDRIKVWINRCQDHDPHKLASGKHIRHLRVIRCDTDPISVVIAPESCQYVALSYVWGEAQEKSPQEGDILGAYIPQTIRDSIKVTLELGYKYLWVDRYCIDQHDQFDKSHQIGQMGAIYARAQLTIFAVAGNNSSHGLPGVRISRRVPFNDVMTGTTYLRHDWDSTEDILSSKWVSRGWTLQESYLSTKRLFFTERQVVFAC
ncbi:heterokaryon incompatibility protein-domain-containing protein, partial [Boeremia exigua]|uniref:heterokaryon incompatibility protein-domain-containing protein n=1 Tax=Boeremia exigua TaxID=749465 RepID=UPI001E8CF86C